jgi:hypothetical protein
MKTIRIMAITVLIATTHLAFPQQLIEIKFIARV